MRRNLFLIVAVFFVFLISCKPGNKKQNVNEEYIVCNFKVIGLADSSVTDSIWRINFLEGVESIYIKPADSLISIKAKPSLITRTELIETIEDYGVQIVDNY